MAKMTITASKTMAKVLQNYFKKYNYKITHQKLTPRGFAWQVDLDTWKHDADFDYIHNIYKVIRVDYPPEDYACPCYLTTYDLTKCFDKSDKTLDGFLQQVKNEIGI